MDYLGTLLCRLGNQRGAREPGKRLAYGWKIHGQASEVSYVLSAGEEPNTTKLALRHAVKGQLPFLSPVVDRRRLGLAPINALARDQDQIEIARDLDQWPTDRLTRRGPHHLAGRVVDRDDSEIGPDDDHAIAKPGHDCLKSLLDKSLAGDGVVPLLSQGNQSIMGLTERRGPTIPCEDGRVAARGAEIPNRISPRLRPPDSDHTAGDACDKRSGEYDQDRRSRGVSQREPQQSDECNESAGNQHPNDETGSQRMFAHVR